MKVTRKSLVARIQRIVRMTKMPIVLHTQSQMPGTRYRVESGDRSSNHSGLMKPNEMEAWLSGYEAALDLLRLEASEEFHSRKNLEDISAQAGERVEACAAPVIGCLFCPCPDCRKIVKDREESRRQTMKGWVEL